MRKSENEQAVHTVVRPPQNAPAPCKWWLEQPPTSFRFIAHRVPLCVPIKFEVSRPSPWEDMTEYPYEHYSAWRPWPVTFWP